MLIFLGFFLYQLTQSESVNSIMILLMLLLGLILGGVIAFLASKKLVSEPSVITESSHTIAESMRKVFKVVSDAIPGSGISSSVLQCFRS